MKIVVLNNGVEVVVTGCTHELHATGQDNLATALIAANGEEHRSGRQDAGSAIPLQRIVARGGTGAVFELFKCTKKRRQPNGTGVTRCSMIKQAFGQSPSGTLCSDATG